MNSHEKKKKLRYPVNVAPDISVIMVGQGMGRNGNVAARSHRLPSTMSAMDSRMRLRRNTIIKSNTTNAMDDTIVNTNQVDLVFSFSFT